MKRARALSGTDRAALLRCVRELVEQGINPLGLSRVIGISEQHAYRLLKAAGVAKYLLSPDEAQIIEARRRIGLAALAAGPAKTRSP
jgi:chaperonin GroEL (HSP60 family)